MKALGPEVPQWLIKLIERLPEPGPKALSTIYGLMLWSLLVQAIVTIFTLGKN